MERVKYIFYSELLTGRIKCLSGGSWLWYVSIHSSNMSAVSGLNSVFPITVTKHYPLLFEFSNIFGPGIQGFFSEFQGDSSHDIKGLHAYKTRQSLLFYSKTFKGFQGTYKSRIQSTNC